jgi:hypothetical protein
LVAAGDVDRAEEVAGSITALGSRAWMLLEVAETLMFAGHTDRAQMLITRAEAVARSITELSSQAGTLIWLATFPVTTGTTAGRLIAASFALANWSLPLSAIVKHQPKVLTALAAEVGFEVNKSDLAAIMHGVKA